MGAKKSVYISDAIQRVIGSVEPGELSARISDIVDRYGVLCQFERDKLEQLFMPNELEALAEASRPKWIPASSIIGGLRSDFEDAGPELYEKHHIDAAAVFQKLKVLNVGQQFALIELLERIRRRKGGRPKGKKA